MCQWLMAKFYDKIMQDAGFEFVDIQRQSMRGVPPIVRPSIRGLAIKHLGV